VTDEELTAQLAEMLVMSRNRQMDAAALLPVVRQLIAQGAADELDAAAEGLEFAVAYGGVRSALRARAAALRGQAKQ
jgi:hypothetical protein